MRSQLTHLLLLLLPLLSGVIAQDTDNDNPDVPDSDDVANAGSSIAGGASSIAGDATSAVMGATSAMMGDMT
ncbi:MAG: hypothetical protein Q9174_003646, partial [Haloplaca sp. 1 TL-2023]